MRFLDDVHWIAVNRLILAINSIDEDIEFRTTVLKQLRFLIPYESAAFFLSDLSKDLATSSTEWRSNPRFVDPVGIDVPPSALEEYVKRYYREDHMSSIEFINKPRVFRESDMASPEAMQSSYFNDYLHGRHVLTSVFIDEHGFYGSLNLNRRRTDNDFSDREVAILELVEPHIFNRLSKWRLRSDRTTSEAAFRRDFQLSAREADVVRCVMAGMSNSEISGKLNIAQSTVKKHLENVFKKTNVNSRVELIMLVQRYMG